MGRAWSALPLRAQQAVPNPVDEGNYIKMAVTELGDPKVFYVDIGTQDACNKPTGCGWHPSIAEHKCIADLLTPVFKSKLGW